MSQDKAVVTTELKVGDTVIRLLAGSVVMYVQITKITDDVIECGDWVFCRKTGVEIDDYLNWGPQYGKSGSFLAVEIGVGINGIDSEETA